MRGSFPSYIYAWHLLTPCPRRCFPAQFAMIDDDVLINQTIDNWCWGADSSGDLRKRGNMEFLWQEAALRAGVQQVGVGRMAMGVGGVQQIGKGGGGGGRRRLGQGCSRWDGEGDGAKGSSRVGWGLQGCSRWGRFWWGPAQARQHGLPGQEAALRAGVQQVGLGRGRGCCCHQWLPLSLPLLCLSPC